MDAMGDVWQPGIFAAAAGEVPFPTVLCTALSDACCVIFAIAAVALASALLEMGFKKACSLFASPEKIWILEGYLTYPGVVFHELSHALFAWLTGAHGIRISLRRRQLESGGTVLGSVDFIPSSNPILQSVQRVASGVAPAVTGLVAMILMIMLAFPSCTQWWQWAIWIYLFVCVLLHSELSSQDLRTAGAGIPWIAAALILVFLVFPFDPISMVAAIASGSGEIASQVVSREAENEIVGGDGAGEIGGGGIEGGSADLYAT